MPDEIEVSTEVDDVGESAGTTAEAIETVDEGASAVEPKFTVTVDGSEVEVTLEELRSGYSRQADYTRKTQELSEQRKELAALAQLKQALDSDPKGTLDALRSAFGLDEVVQSDEELDPIERELNELKSWRAQQEAAAAEQRVLAEATKAISDNGLETSPDELLQFALDRRIGDLGTAAELLAIKKQKEAAVVETAAVTEKKRSAAVVEGGKSRPPAAVPSTTRPRTIAESWRLAKQQLGAA